MVTRLNEGLAKVSKTKKTPVRISLFSEGGDVYSALAIYSALRHYAGPVIIFAEGLVASAAVLILAAGDRRLISEHAHICLHKGSSEVEGDVNDLKAEGDQLDNLEDQFCRLLAKRTGNDYDIWNRLHLGTTYIDAKRAVELNLATELMSEKKR